MNSRKWILLAFALLLAAMLSGCGGSEPPIVQYLGTTLVVDGTSYERRTSAEIHLPGELVPGQVFVTEQVGQHGELAARLDELGLVDRDSYEPVYSFLVTVPMGWEDQWARALMAQSQIQYAELNFMIPFDPGFEAPGPVQYLDTTLVVDGMRYERRTSAEVEFFGSSFLEGLVYVGAKAGQNAALEARLDELGLVNHDNFDSASFITVQVAAGWEDQWSRALIAQPQVEYTFLNFMIFLDDPRPLVLLPIEWLQREAPQKKRHISLHHDRPPRHP